MIAQTPGQVIQAMRLALTNNTVARLSREDLKLPAGFTMERRVPQIRKPDEDPIQSLLGPAKDWSYPTIERSSDHRLAQYQESMSLMVQSAVVELKQHVTDMLEMKDDSVATSANPDGATPMEVKAESSQPSRLSRKAVARPPTQLPPMQPMSRMLSSFRVSHLPCRLHLSRLLFRPNPMMLRDQRKRSSRKEPPVTWM